MGSGGPFLNPQRPSAFAYRQALCGTGVDVLVFLENSQRSA